MTFNKFTTWTLLIPCLIVGLAGCRNTPRMQRTVEQLGQQRREIEDRFYELQYEYEKLADVARELQDENEILRKRLASFTGDETLDEREDIPELKDVSPRGADSAPIPVLPVENNEVIVDGNPVVQGISFRQSARAATQLSLNKIRTTGRDFDGRLGDDGFVVHLEPLDEHGNPVITPAPVEVTAFLESDPDAVAARWSLSASEIQRVIRNNPTNRGIPIEIKWPGKMPNQSQATLVVRMKTNFGDFATARIVVPIYHGPNQSWSPER